MKNYVKTWPMYLISILGTIAISLSAQADTVGNYMTIIDNIPKMAMKPDEQSQAWVRSARNIVTSTDEAMVQTIISVNSVAMKQGRPVFCFSPGAPFDAGTADQLIQKTYAELLKTQGTSVSSMTVSDVLIIGMASQYSCSASVTPVMAYATAASPMPVMPAASTATAATQPVMPAPASNIPADSNPYATPTQVSVSAETPPVL